MNLGVILSVLIAQSFVHAEITGRGFVTDHPGPIDSPKTALPGEYRVEANVAAFTRGATTYGSFYYSAGAAPNAEIQIGVDGLKVLDSAPDGLGAASVRLKQNVVGNDSGSFALAIVPKLVFTGELGGHQLNGGLGVPMAQVLVPAWTLALMPGWDYVKTSSAPSQNLYTVPMVLTRDLSAGVAAFIQISHTFDDAWRATRTEGIGCAVRPSPRVQIDVQVDHGRSGDVDITSLLLGTSVGF